MKNRFRQVILWVAVAGLIGMALVDFNIIQDPAVFDKYVDKIVYILVLAGVLVEGPVKIKK